MPDAYATITETPEAVLEQMAAAMELRAADPQQQAFLVDYVGTVPLPPQARVLEIGCGVGAIARALLAAFPAIGELVGVDPSPYLVALARERTAAAVGLRFEVADGRSLDLPDEGFDAVVLHTVLSHVPGPERVVREAFRVLRPGGWLAAFDGDYATMTVATNALDPLEACVDAFRDSFINDPFVVRRLTSMAGRAGFTDCQLRSHGYVQTTSPDYLLSVVVRGATALAQNDRAGEALARALEAEAARRVETGSFFGFIGYASLVARKPGEQAGA